MSQLSRKLRRSTIGISFWCPGCNDPHHITTGANGWAWNGDAERPVCSPSVLVTGLRVVRDEQGRWNGGWVLDAAGEPVPERCHSFIGCQGAQPGQIVFLRDSTHHLAGKTFELADWPPYYFDKPESGAAP